jgi:chlorobactene glucosyltransferase
LPVYLLFSSLMFVAALPIIWWVHRQARLDLKVSRQFTSVDTPLVSILVPARNEEHNIERCVESLLCQDYPSFEVIVVDDRSTDSTPGILRNLARRSSQLAVIRGMELPPGWAGKPHALFQAAEAAHGEWLVFVDADTWLQPDALQATLGTALRHQADLFTTMHRQVMDTFWERTVQPLVLLGLSIAFPPRQVNREGKPQAVANGQYIMIRRSTYDAIGGHAGVKGEIVEDKALAVRVKQAGYRLLIADGIPFVSTRMYRSLGEMWEGWTKNIFLGLRDQPRLMALGVFGAILALIAVFCMPAWPVIGWGLFRRGGGNAALAVLVEALVVWGFLLLKRGEACRAFEIPTWYALTLPIGAAIFASMMFGSTWRVISGHGVTWKGRTYY